MKEFPYDEIYDAIDDQLGYCTYCEDFTADGVEPDAENYDCPVCDQPNVYGVEQALLMGLLNVGE